MVAYSTFRRTWRCSEKTDHHDQHGNPDQEEDTTGQHARKRGPERQEVLDARLALCSFVFTICRHCSLVLSAGPRRSVSEYRRCVERPARGASTATRKPRSASAARRDASADHDGLLRRSSTVIPTGPGTRQRRRRNQRRKRTFLLWRMPDIWTLGRQAGEGRGVLGNDRTDGSRPGALSPKTAR